MARSRQILTVLGLAAAAATTLSLPTRAADSNVTPVQVRTLDFVQRLDAETLRARVGLVTGEAIEFEVTDRATFLHIAQVFAGGRARLNAQIQDRKVVGLGVTIPEAGFTAADRRP